MFSDKYQTLFSHLLIEAGDVSDDESESEPPSRKLKCDGGGFIPEPDSKPADDEDDGQVLLSFKTLIVSYNFLYNSGLPCLL